MIKKYSRRIRWAVKLTLLLALGVLSFIKATELIEYNRDLLLAELNEQSDYQLKKQKKRNSWRGDLMRYEMEKQGNSSADLIGKIKRLRELTQIRHEQILELRNLKPQIEPAVMLSKVDHMEKGFEAYFSSIARFCETTDRVEYYRKVMSQTVAQLKSEYSKKPNNVINSAIALKLQAHLLGIENELLTQLSQQIELKANYYIY